MGGTKKIFFLPLLLFFGSFLAIEIFLRAFLETSPEGEIKLFQQELPPLKIFSSPYSSLSSKNGEPSEKDLAGIFRSEGGFYSYQENAISPMGWWRSNNIGASSFRFTEKRIPKGKKRLLVFGDSYARGSRIPMEQSWGNVLQYAQPKLEVVNLAVDGYSMGLSLQRFQKIAENYDFSSVLFVFSPDSDLWRDVNVIRYLGEGWPGIAVFSRYALEDGRLVLIQPSAKLLENGGASPEARAFLRKYDPFYISFLYDSPPIFGRLVIYKVFAKVLGELQRKRIFERMKTDMQAESMQVTEQIFSAAEKMAKDRGKEFVLILLPEPNVVFEIKAQTNGFRKKVWQERASFLRARGWKVVDLLPMFEAMPLESIDRGYDGSHYGAKVNRLIGLELAKIFAP